MVLSQLEADLLIQMEKKFSDTTQLILGEFPIKISRELSSLDAREIFHFDITKNMIKLSKVTIQNRSRIVYILARVDFGGSPHQNPDGELIFCPHIHIYREGYNDKWAYPLADISGFRDSTDFIENIEDFSDYCHIIELPPIQLSHV